MRFFLATLILTACGGNSTPAPADPAPTPAPAVEAKSDGQLTEFEETIVGPILEEVRTGVTAFGENSVGICQGSGRDCEQFMGLDAGELPPGKYMLRGEFLVPRYGEQGTWKVNVKWNCKITNVSAQGKVTENEIGNEREHKLVYAGKRNGYRLSPLLTIQSPDRAKRDCTWEMTFLHPDSPKTLTGSWSIPAEQKADAPAEGTE